MADEELMTIPSSSMTEPPPLDVTSFHKGQRIGWLYEEDGKMCFEGKYTESAQAFFDLLCRMFEARLAVNGAREIALVHAIERAVRNSFGVQFLPVADGSTSTTTHVCDFKGINGSDFDYSERDAPSVGGATEGIHNSIEFLSEVRPVPDAKPEDS